MVETHGMAVQGSKRQWRRKEWQCKAVRGSGDARKGSEDARKGSEKAVKRQ